MLKRLLDGVKGRIRNQRIARDFRNLLNHRSPVPGHRRVSRHERLAVCHVSPGYFSDDSYIGGGERYPTALSQAMAAHADVTFVSFGNTRKSFLTNGVKLELFPLGDQRGTFSKDAFAIDEALTGHDLIHCHQYYTLPTAIAVAHGRATGTPVFVTDHGGPDGRARPLLVQCAAGVSGILAVSAHSLRDMPSMIPHSLIYGGVDPEFFAVSKTTREPRFIYIGRILPHKGIDILIESMPADVPLEIHGRPYHTDYLRRLKQLTGGKTVEFHHESTDSDLRAALARSTALVLPSVYRDCYGDVHPSAELLGLVLLEALATGTAVICTDVGGMPEVITHEHTGFIVPPNDSVTLGSYIEKLATDPTLAAAIGRAGKRVAEQRYTWDAAARRCLEGYRTLGA